MIVTKTPLRISFFGGGSDIPSFYKEHGGFVLSSSIDSHIYIAANRCVEPHLKVVYSKLELETDVENIKHDRVREILKYQGINSNIELSSFSDVNTKGTGLGSSSTFTVGVLNAVNRLVSDFFYGSKYDLAKHACKIEIDKCREPIGEQDQFAAAYGGLNAYKFNKSGYVEVIPVRNEYVGYLNNCLVCFDTGINRGPASNILTKQVENIKSGDAIQATKNLMFMGMAAWNYLERGKLNDFGSLLDDAWKVKKTLSDGISNEFIDTMYEDGMKAGALGGKILGAGGGGYMLFYVPSNKADFLETMTKKYKRFNFNLSDKGSYGYEI